MDREIVVEKQVEKLVVDERIKLVPEYREVNVESTKIKQVEVIKDVVVNVGGSSNADGGCVS